MSVIARGTTKSVKIVYPQGCKEITEELGKDELVRRLKLIARAFQDMGQDDNEQFSGLALHLATDFFLEHPNKDVRLLVACCIADVFRVFAPEAPYRDASHLKDIFMFLIKQLRGLEDTNSPNFKRYFYLLENLAWVKSFNICIELDDNQEIFCSLFKLMFSVINEKHTAKVKSFMLDMMSPLLTEADTVSQELLDILLMNIVEPHKTQNRQAYNLANELLVRTCEAIEPYVQAFFNNALMLGKTSESDLSEHLYDLIYELYAICPSVLLAVLPQLEFKLKSNEESERKAVTKILAKMFSDSGSNLAEQNKPLWICFLGRFNDISITVRTVCVQSAVNFVVFHPELVKDVVEQVKIRQHDAEETVRQEVVTTLLNIAKKNFDVVSDDMLEIIKERTRDKRFKIRQSALMGLCTLYKTITGTVPVNESHLKKIVWVKDKVFHGYYQQNPDDRLMVERLFNICLVPYTLPVNERMKRLFQLYASLDEPANKAFHEMLKHRHMVRTCVKFLLDGLNLMSANPKEHFPFLPKLQQIARTLPEQQKSLDQLKKFNELLRDDKRLRALMQYLVSADCNCKKANSNVKEILKKLGGDSANSSQGQLLMYNTVKSLLERVAPVMVDTNAIEVLVKHIADVIKDHDIVTDGGIERAGEKGVQLLWSFSGVFPQYFNSKESLDLLISFLNNEDDVVVDTTLQIFTNCGQDLETEYPDIFTKVLPILQHTAKIGNPKQAKHAIRCIYKIARNKEAVLSLVFEYVKNNLKPESANYITSIVVLGHISYLCPEEFAPSMRLIVSKDIVKDVLMQDRTHGEQVMDSWYSDHLVTEETQAKMQAMKLLMRWLMGLKSNLNSSGTSTLRLLYTIILHEGDLMEKGLINKPELARLRLQAGCCLLKLSEEPVFADLLQREQFQALSLLINDSCYHVRVKFADKLHKGLFSLKLPLEFMSIFSLAANDPVRERRTCIKKYIQMNIQRRRDFLKQNPQLGGKMFQYLPDYVMPYTIHLLAHDPDLKSYEDVQALKNIKECLWFVMEPLVARSEDYNYHFFRRLIENIKQAKDAQAPDDEDSNKKLYSVCDLALGLLQKNLTNIVLKDSNVDPVLPKKLFIKLDKGLVNSTIYLPKNFNFEKKKGLVDTIDPPSGSSVQPSYYRGRRQEQPTLETIIVKSPGPVVNPNPTSPREPRIKVKKDKEELSQDSSEPATTTKKSPHDVNKQYSFSLDNEMPETLSDSSVAEESQSTETSIETTVNIPTESRKTLRGKARKAATPLVVDSPSSMNKTDSETTEDKSQETKTLDELSLVSSDMTTPPKKRVLKRKIADVGEKDSSQLAVRKPVKNSRAKSQTDIKGTSLKGKDVVNGVTKGAKGVKRPAESESDSEKQSGDTDIPIKKRKVKLAKKTPIKKQLQADTDQETAISEPPAEIGIADPLAATNCFKSPGFPAPKATSKKGCAATKRKSAAAKINVELPVESANKSQKSPESDTVSPSLKSTDESPISSASDLSLSSQKSTKRASGKKNLKTNEKTTEMESPTTSTTDSLQGSASDLASPKTTKIKSQRKSPRPAVSPKMKVNANVRRAKPLSNGTAKSGTGMTMKKASALSRAILKGQFGKDNKRPTGKGKKK